MIRNALSAGLTVVLLGTACGGSTPDVRTAESCPELADAHIAARQDYLNEVADMSMGEYDALVESTEGSGPPAQFVEFEQETELFETRTAELGCSQDGMKTLIRERIHRLEPRGPVGEFLIKQYDY